MSRKSNRSPRGSSPFISVTDELLARIRTKALLQDVMYGPTKEDIEAMQSALTEKHRREAGKSRG